MIPRRTDKSRNHADRNPSLPKSGEKVECVLLSEKARNHSTRAKLMKRLIVGLITNTAAVPISVKLGYLPRGRDQP
jgi:hypothetical protein